MQVTAETPGEWGCPEPGLWDKAHRRLRDRSTHFQLSQKWVKWRLVSPESFPTACGCSHPCWRPTGTMIRRMLSIVFQHFYFLKGNVQSIFHGDENYTRNHLLYSGRGIIVLSFLFDHKDFRSFETLSWHRRINLHFCLLVERVS